MFEYYQGYIACMKGLAAETDRSKEYNSGYSDRFYIEQEITAIELEIENE